ncbi:endonuclease [Flavobacteriaceae bacterium S356]|uniref:Endonuclease n=1 Tax=Asprobacillus argus TaxID=3076534 RepID=A0ABU3LD16_9FLAO|nr:endonuclease [Flavobacteriaceae bacterium S356]
MKKLTPLLMLLFSITAFAQIPTYYNDVNLNLTGVALKNELATKIINTHTNSLSYSNIWDASKITDVNPLNSLEVLLIYGYEDGSDGDTNNDRERGINDTCGAGSCVGLWNREHVFANSLATPDLDASGTSGPPYADAHNLRPCDSPTNSSRGNKLFATGSGNSGAVTGGWYPGDEWKGDVARIAMYMYLRYGSQCLPTALGVGDSSSTPDDMIDLFLQWNVDDPVSDFEKQRNTYHDSAGTYAQGNRNPFIDNPAFATTIWGGAQAEDLFGGGSSDTEAPTVPMSLASSSITGSSFSVSWAASTDNVAVTGYNILFNGLVVGTSNTTSYDATGLSASTAYTVTVQAYDAAGNTSSASSSLVVNTTSGGGGSATDLFLSEYIEGSSNNKALEVANFTGSTVDLTIYSLKKQTNGAGSWSSGLSLTGNLANGSVFIVAHSSASSTITSVADITTAGAQITFNGNDPVGLFKNDVLIDIIGTFDGGGTNFAQNVTLQRKSSVSSPNTTYTTSEWNTLATDTFSGLDSHTFDGSGTPDTEAPTAPSSLSSSNVNVTTVDLSWTASTDNIAVASYAIYSSGSLIASTSSTSYTVTGLTGNTAYSFTVRANDAAANQSGNSNTENVTTATADTEDPTTPTSLVASNTTQTTTDLSWTASTDNVAVTSYTIYQGGSEIATSATNSYSVTGLTASTSYSFTVRANDAAANQSTDSNAANITTSSAPSGVATDLYFSEYIEGSSNNKALEVANFTGSSVDLSIYSLKKQTNGAGSWSSGLSLTGTLVNGDVFVVANSSADAAITGEADITTGGTQVTFNGNDPVGLFKNDVLIDIIGTFDDASVFAQNVTLRRKSTVTSPNTTYTTSEWDTFLTDNFSDVGSHTITGTHTFLGNTDSDWDTPANWSIGTVPSGTAVIISAGQTVTASGSISITNLTLESNSALTVTTNVTNSGTVTLNSGASLIAKNSTAFDLTYSRSLGTNNWYLVSSAVTNETLEDIITNHTFATGSSSNIGIGDYVNTTPGWTYATSASTGTLSSGEGRSVKLAVSGDISFSGAMPLSDVSITISDGGGSGNGFNLIGNPFPSYITGNHTSPLVSNNILSANSGILEEQTLWFWDQVDKEYDQINQASALVDGIRYIPPGQGFFVKSNASGGSFSFPESMQSHQSTDAFSRSGNTNENYTHIKLKLSDQTTTKNADIIYIPNATHGWDNGFDASLFGGASNSFAIYTELVADNQGQKLGIQSLPNSNFNEVVAVGVNASAGTEITISANSKHLPQGTEVYLEDRLNGTFTILDTSSKYTTTLSNDITGTGRFYLHISADALSIDDDALSGVNVYTNNYNELRIIGIHNADTNLILYDIIGKKIFNTSFIGNGNNTITLPNVKTGIYIIQLQTSQGKLSNKIVIE